MSTKTKTAAPSPGRLPLCPHGYALDLPCDRCAAQAPSPTPAAPSQVSNRIPPPSPAPSSTSSEPAPGEGPGHSPPAGSPPAAAPEAVLPVCSGSELLSARSCDVCGREGVRLTAVDTDTMTMCESCLTADDEFPITKPSAPPADRPNPMLALYAALARASGSVDPLRKDGFNNFHKYPYVTSEAVIRAARDALSKQGLVLITRSATFEASADRDSGYALQPCTYVVQGSKNSAQGEEVAYFACFVFELVHGAGGRVLYGDWRWPVEVEPGKTLAKALAAAQTEGLAYFLRTLLLIPRGSDEDPPRGGGGGDGRRDERPRGSSGRPGGGSQRPANAPPARKPTPISSDRAEAVISLLRLVLRQQVSNGAMIEEFISATNDMAGCALVDDSGEFNAALLNADNADRLEAEATAFLDRAAAAAAPPVSDEDIPF